MRTIRIVLADDHLMVRQGLAGILEDSAGIAVIGQAGDGAEALRLAFDLAPDVLILDYSMPSLDSATVIEKLNAENSEVRVLVLTVHENPQYAVRALQAGAHGFLLKTAAADELIKAVRCVDRGKIYVSPMIYAKIVEQLPVRNGRAGLKSLSPREFQVLRYLAAGNRLKDCARLMKVSESAVSTYRARLMRKLGLENVADLIRFAIANGITG